MLAKFKNRRINILVATDVAARGIDIQNLTHVINYSLPQDAESYLHKVGRTGRAGNEGTAITFVTRRENRSLISIQKLSKGDIRKGKIPAVNEIINTKKKWIKNELLNMTNINIDQVYHSLAKDLLKDSNPDELIATLLKYSFKSELDSKSYTEIRDAKPEIIEQTRLFIAMGKRDGMTKRSIVKFIKDRAKTYEEKITDVQVFDTYSFITVPFREAEIILHAFRKDKLGKFPVIEKAEKRKG